MRSGPVPRNILRVICANEILIGIMIIFRPRQTSGDHVARVCALPHRENIAHGCNWSSSSLNGVQHDQQYLFCAAIQFSQLVGLRHKRLFQTAVKLPQLKCIMDHWIALE